MASERENRSYADHTASNSELLRTREAVEQQGNQFRLGLAIKAALEDVRRIALYRQEHGGTVFNPSPSDRMSDEEVLKAATLEDAGKSKLTYISADNRTPQEKGRQQKAAKVQAEKELLLNLIETSSEAMDRTVGMIPILGSTLRAGRTLTLRDLNGYLYNPYWWMEPATTVLDLGTSTFGFGGWKPLVGGYVGGEVGRLIGEKYDHPVLGLITGAIAGGFTPLSINTLNRGINKSINTYRLAKELDKAASSFDGTVGANYFRSPSNWYRLTESPEILGLLEQGRNITTTDLNTAISPVEEFRQFVLESGIIPGTGNNEGYWVIPRKKTLSLSKSGAAHGNTSQAAKGEIWQGTVASGKVFPKYVIEGEGPALTFRGFNPATGADSRTNFVQVPWEEIPLGARIGFHTGEMPMEGLRAFRELPNGRYLYEGLILPNKTRFKVGDIEIDDPNLAYRLLNDILKDFFKLGYVRSLSDERPRMMGRFNLLKHFPNPMFAQGRLWYDGSTVRSGGSPKFRELLVTRQPLQFANHNARPVLADVEGRRIPLFDKQLTPQNTSAYRWEDGYGYRRVLPPEDRQRARFIFSERPSTLTLLELAGTPKIERNFRTHGHDYSNPIDYGRLYQGRAVRPESPKFGSFIDDGAEASVFLDPDNPNMVLKVNTDWRGSLLDFFNNYVIKRNRVPFLKPLIIRGRTLEGFPVFNLEKVTPMTDEQYIQNLPRIKEMLRQRGFVGDIENEYLSNGSMRIGDFNPNNVAFDSKGNIVFIDVDAYKKGGKLNEKH